MVDKYKNRQQLFNAGNFIHIISQMTEVCYILFINKQCIFLHDFITKILNETNNLQVCSGLKCDERLVLRKELNFL